jgi:glyoxylase-like metal-dependent hydrolase (beta-lactamase superfamily II)
MHRPRRAVFLGFAGAMAAGLLRAQSSVPVAAKPASPVAAPVSAEATSGRGEVEAAAKALGGLNAVLKVKNLTLIGYGQYAYQFGGGNVTASLHAVQRFQAANDLRRVFDFEHGRFQQTERRYMSFTFALASLTSWAPYNQILDGDLAYDIGADGGMPKRIPRFTQTAWQVDGSHMRRMWMLNNPVALVRAALDPGTALSSARLEKDSDGEVRVMDLQLKEGDKLTFAVSAKTHLPAWIRWVNPHNNFGQLTFTTYLEGYVPVAGLLLPLSYQTMIDWRNIDYFNVHVDGYEIDGKIADLAAPDAVRRAPEPQVVLQKVTARPIAKGIWYITAGSQGTAVFEFDDHLALFDLNQKDYAKPIIDFARTLVPGKAPTELITSHQHQDHVDGIREAVAEGLTIISRRDNERIIREMVTHPSPDYPDQLSKHPRALKFIPVDEHLRLADKSMTLDVYWVRNNSHMGDGLFAYAPAAKVMAEADIATAARDYQYWADNYMDDLEYYKLDVDTLLPVHFPPMKQAEVIEFIKYGVKAGRERCIAETAKGNPHIGRPILTHRY